MKLSQAIREGLKDTLPISYHLTYRDDEGDLHACALGCAHIGIGGDPNMASDSIWTSIESTWPELKGVEVPDTVLGGSHTCPLEEAIYDRNDTLHWSREEIADWVEEQGY